MHRQRLLLLTSDDGLKLGGGREQLSRLLHNVLAECAEVIGTVRIAGRTRPVDGLTGRLCGLDTAREAELRQILADPSLEGVFIDGSNLGFAARIVRAVRPDLQVTTFFHNCETRFFADALRAGPSPRAMAVLAGHWQAERLALRLSSVCITLSDRDSRELERRFARSADAVLPLALADNRDQRAEPVLGPEPYVLFVGGGFFGNLGGLRWYAREVAPRLAVRTRVIGRGLDALKGALPPMMELVGPVADLSPWYAGASLVVAPILAGSGMKAKVAEALMHGKRVVGTSEAFSGYGAQVVAANALCDGAQPFADEIARALATPAPRFDPALRALYEQHHSRAAFCTGLGAILKASYPPAASRR